MFISGVFFMSKKGRKSLQNAIGASYSILGALALFGFGGYWLDKNRGLENFWRIIGLVLGIIVGLYELSKLIFKE